MYKEPVRPRFVKGYGQNWKQLRENSGIENEKLFENTGMDKSTISRIETETRTPTLAQIYKYQDLFNVPVDYLTGRMKVSDLATVQDCEMMPISDRAWCTIHSCVPEILSMILETPEFQRIVDDYTEINRKWDNQKAIDSDDALKAYEFAEKHKDELAELDCSVILRHGIEKVKGDCQRLELDITQNSSAMHRRIMKRITGIDIFER